VIVDKKDTEAVAMCAPGSGGDESASVVRHELYVGMHAHNHPPSNEVMRTAIPAEAMEEAMRMRSTSHTTCRDIIRHVKDKYRIPVHRNRLRRNLTAAHARLHPTESNCN